jgi:hypothetical protein
MAGKSKLTPHQWAEIEERLLAGESQSQISKDYNVTQRAISKQMSARVKTVEIVAHQMVEAKKAFDTLPISSRVNAQTLIDRLMSISDHMSSAAEYSARNAHKLSRLANKHLDSVDPEAIGENPNVLRVVTGLTNMANEASKIPLGLISANKEQMQRISDPESEQVKTLDEFYGNSSTSTDA